MSAYEHVRDDVIRQYHEAVQLTVPRGHEEGLARPAAIPEMRISGSQPAWLADTWRKALAIAALTGATIGLALVAWAALTSGGDDDALVIGFGGSFATVAFVVSYFTVAGFGKAEFSIGSGPGAGG